MGRKSKVSQEIKIEAVNDYLNGLGSYLTISRKYKIGKRTLIDWVRKYKTFGEVTFDEQAKNSSYTKEFKEKVVLAYLNGEGSSLDLAIKFKISSSSTILKWVNQYNSHIELKDYIPGGEDIYMAKSRKVSKEERIEIVKYCLEHDLDYKGTAKLYKTTYANVFNWVKKYKENGEDGLGDKRGKHKTDEEVDEITLLKRQLKRMEHERDMALLENKLLKKLDEIERRRSIEQANMKMNIKRSKK